MMTRYLQKLQHLDVQKVNMNFDFDLISGIIC